MKIAIIGAGLAGCALAYVLKHAGEEPVIYEAGPTLASGASGNSLGFYNPRFCALRGPESDFYSAGFSMALRSFGDLGDIDWNPCGALHLVNDEKKAKRFAQTVQNWGWDEENMRLVSEDEASDIAGVELRYPALHLPQSGSVSPKNLCAAYTRDVEVRLNTPVEDLDALDAEIKILTCGPAVEKFVPSSTITAVRGQITEVESTALSEKLKCTLGYSGSFSPSVNGRHVVGSTFQRWAQGVDVNAEDDVENLKNLADNVPGLEHGLTVVGQRAAMRATSRDYFPLVGALKDGLYVSSAHGSYGIVSSLISAHLLTDMILGRPRCVGGNVIAALSPGRFL